MQRPRINNHRVFIDSLSYCSPVECPFWSLPIFLSAEMRRTRMDKDRGAFCDVVFGVSRPERLFVAGVEEFREARQELDRGGFGSLGGCLRRRAHPFPEAGERPPYLVGDGVGRELWHFAESLPEMCQVFREDFASDASVLEPHDEAAALAYEARYAGRPEPKRKRDRLPSPRYDMRRPCSRGSR